MARILVLDDERDACDLIERVLSPEFQVASFTEEDEAVEYYRNNQVDLAILDIKLKKMSGIDVLSLLMDIKPDLKAIMLTGYPTLETAKRAITLGAYDYLVKPLDIDQLEAKVRQVLSPREKMRRDEEDMKLDDDSSSSD